MESHHQQIHQAKNSQENTKKSNYVIVREDQEVEGTPSTKKLQAFPPPKCSYPPGYRFMPTDDELILEYLQKKVDNQPIPIREITDVYLKQNNPKALTATYPKLGENEWYFFTPRDRKYPNGSRPNRAADTGYWKATGADKPVKFQGNVVGFRKALVFYEGKPPKGQKTSWIMHEFRLNRLPRTKRNAEDMRLDDWVLCRIYEKTSRPNNRNRQGNEGGDLSVDDDDQNRLQVNTDNEALMSHDGDNAAAFVDNNENLGEFDMAENLAPFADHWLQQSLVISPDHHSMDEPALINGHIQLDYGLLNTAGHLQQNAFSGTPCLNEQDHQQALIGFQQGDFLASWGNGTFQQLPSYLGSSSSSKSNSINTTSYDSLSFMKIENPFNGVVTSNPDYDPYMPRKRRL